MCYNGVNMVFTFGHKLNIGNQFAKGNKHTLEWKQKTKERMIGNKKGFKKGHKLNAGVKHKVPSHWKGKKLPYQVWNKGLKGYKAGEQHYNWKGGVNVRDYHSLFSVEYVKWRKDVFTRDNFKCRIANDDCKGQLEVHHILRWSAHPKLRFDINNGITLCHFHHPRKKTDEIKLVSTFRKILTLI